MIKETIYIYLLDEGVDVWRPVEAMHIKDDLYRITSINPDDENEKWQFSTGDLVQCEMKILTDSKRKQELVAVNKIYEENT
jgi:hypothetical protein